MTPAETPARVLVVDDNPATLYSTARVLRAADFKVTEGSAGYQALELALKGTDVLILDVNLPDIHGFEVCRRLRKDPKTARLPIIHVSATFVKESDKVEGLDAGCDGYLTHPIEPPVLIATVNAFLRARKIEEELRESEDKFKAVFENALSGLLILDRSLNFVEVNPALCEMLGHPREELLGQSLFAFVAPESNTKSQAVAARFQRRQAWSETLSLLRSDNSTVHLDWYISAGSDPPVVVVTDISKRVELETQRQQLLASERAARAEAERANRLKDEFLGNLSHELRTPLNSILLWTTVLQQNPNDKERLLRGLDAIEHNTKVQTQLISDLLDLSRITSGKLRLEVAPTALAAVVKASLEVLLPSVAAKEIRLDTALDAGPIQVTADPSRMQQIIWNLVSNAIKFTAKRGHVEVRLERVDSHAVLTVSDNGQGIKPELLPHLFERFRQGDSASDRAHSGLGLGLAIVKHLTELHGGTVVATSAGEGCGATFTVQLPIAAAYETTSHDEAATPDLTASTSAAYQTLLGIRVLAVDDDVDTCEVISRILQEAGAQVASAHSADDALAMLQEFPAQALVSDIGMPQRDGYDLIREVRSRGYSSQRLPAIALTALARPEDRQRALLAGFQLHLAKPVDGSELTAAVGALVGRTDLAPPTVSAQMKS